MHTLSGHRAAKIADGRDNPSGHDIGFTTIVAPRTPPSRVKTEPSCSLSFAHDSAVNSATALAHASSAHLVEPTPGPSSVAAPFDSGSRTTGSSGNVDLTQKRHRGP